MATLTVELTRAQAESILNANSVAIGETTTAAVDAGLCTAITAKWPTLRAEYGAPGDPHGEYYVRTEHIGNMATHDWVLRVETWEREPSAEYPHPKRETYAAPEIAGVPPGEPFVTVIAQESDLRVLFPRHIPDSLRVACLAAPESAGLMHRAADRKLLHSVCVEVLHEWHRLIRNSQVWWDALAGVWREPD